MGWLGTADALQESWLWVNWRAGLREFDRGLERFIKNTKVQVLVALYFLCDLLPRLPDPIAKKIVDKVMAALGLGD